MSSRRGYSNPFTDESDVLIGQADGITAIVMKARRRVGELDHQLPFAGRQISGHEISPRTVMVPASGPPPARISVLEHNSPRRFAITLRQREATSRGKCGEANPALVKVNSMRQFSPAFTLRRVVQPLRDETVTEPPRDQLKCVFAEMLRLPPIRQCAGVVGDVQIGRCGTAPSRSEPG